MIYSDTIRPKPQMHGYWGECTKNLQSNLGEVFVFKKRKNYKNGNQVSFLT